MNKFGEVLRRDSELRDAALRRVTRRRQWQMVQGETCESGAKVDGGPWTVDQRPVKPVGLPTKTKDRPRRSRIRVVCRQAFLVMPESRLEKINKSRAQQAG